MSEHDSYDHLPQMRDVMDPDSDEEMAAAARVMECDHAEQDTPVFTARMRNGNDQVTVRAFAGARLLTFTFPHVALGDGTNMVGCVRTVPVGWQDMASAETLAACMERHLKQYERLGWERA